MPGYDRARIVGLSEKDLDEFTCGICQEIFRNPVVAQCCQQTYCRTCIEEWLNTGNTCPNDRKPMRINDLNPPPRFAVNFLNNMKIKCEYQEMGCDVITTIGELTKHLDECEHKLDKNCKTCGLLIDSVEEHSCIANLVIKNCCINDELNKLRKELEQLKQNSTLGMSSVIRLARQSIDDFVVEDPIFRITQEQKRCLIENCKEVIMNNYNYQTISNSLYHRINESKVCEGSRPWNALVFSSEGGESLVCTHQYFRIRFDKLVIELFTAGGK